MVGEGEGEVVASAGASLATTTGARLVLRLELSSLIAEAVVCDSAEVVVVGSASVASTNVVLGNTQSAEASPEASAVLNVPRVLPSHMQELAGGR